MRVQSDLRDQVVVVIGGSSGIGAAVLEGAMQAGGIGFAITRSGAAPVGAKGLVADVDEPGAVAQAFATIGRIDHLVFTAGARLGAPTLNALDTSSLALAFRTKLFGAIEAARLSLGHLAPTGSITLTSGQVSRKYGKGSLLKGAVNAAVEATARHLAKELAPRRVNAICPGVFDTDLWGPAGSEGRAATINRVSAALPLGRVGQPEEAAQAYLFAMTNGFLTGSVLDVDGGGLL
jgi:NAD(P)-dependent dehydrogenase (short-subunit alcohol dehydrogenase family)